MSSDQYAAPNDLGACWMPSLRTVNSSNRPGCRGLRRTCIARRATVAISWMERRVVVRQCGPLPSQDPRGDPEPGGQDRLRTGLPRSTIRSRSSWPTGWSTSRRKAWTMSSSPIPARNRSTRPSRSAIADHRVKGDRWRFRLIGCERGYHGVNFGGISRSPASCPTEECSARCSLATSSLCRCRSSSPRAR